MTRLQQLLALPERDRLMGEPADRHAPTCSGAARLVEVNDLDAHELEPGDVLVVPFSYGLGPLVVDAVKTGVAGEDNWQYEVPVIVGRIEIDRMRPRRPMVTLAFAPEELCRVREVPT